MKRAAIALIALTSCSSDPAGVRGIDPSETRVIPSLEKEVSVLRAEMNVAHVFAEDLLDLHRVQGFVTAQDRYVQIELTRRFGAGTLSEVLGELGVPIDATARAQGTRYVADRIWAAASPEMKERFEAYAEGINAYIAVVQRKQLPVPEEIEIVGGLLKLDDPTRAMQPMTGYDVAAVAAVLMSRLGYENTDLVRQQIADRLEELDVPEATKRELIEDAFLAVAPVHPLVETRPGETTNALLPERKRSLHRAPVERSMLARLVERTNAYRELLGKRDDFGSNAWAVSERGTKGGAILANDGHLPLTVPSLFYQMCLDADYFDADELHVCGLFFPGFPLLAVGTNGHVAWGQTYLDGDVNDFYREELRLGDDGLPIETTFLGEPRPLERIDERYRIGMSDEEEIIPRFVTFDGRFLISVEGDLLEDREEGAFFALGDWIRARDVDGDGVIEGISFDWTAFDIGQTIDAVDGFSRAKTIDDFEEQTKKLIGYAQNIIVADEEGAVMYTGYHALPCRDELDWGPGGNPQQVLDGTRYGGFDVSSGCTIPFEAGPRVKSPASGYVLTANHDPLGNALDDDLSNDAHYIGGPWALGYRARTIDAKLAELVASGSATIESMAELQSDHRSSLGMRYGPTFLAAIASSTSAAAQEVSARIQTWIDRGAIASSGVDTFYASYDADQKKDAAATMIFNAWLRRFTELIFADEGAHFVFGASDSRGTFRTVDRLMNRSPEPALFDVLGTPAIETRDDLIRMALYQALADLADRFGTSDMDRWLWGLEHQVHFKALLEEVGANNPLVGLIAFKFGLTTELLPLAPDLDASDPRASLVHFPRDGDWFGVDAANPGLLRRPYTYSNGPVMRMVIHLDDGEVRGQNILPGGQSGLIGDPHFYDQAARWLGNETIPLRYTAKEAVEGATSRELFVPSR